MASEQLNKVIERIKSQPQNPSGSMSNGAPGWSGLANASLPT